MLSSEMWSRVDLGLHKDLHSVISQKTTFFIVTAVKTSNLTIITLIGEELGQVFGIGSCRKWQEDFIVL
jgi:hypothetical protein